MSKQRTKTYWSKDDDKLWHAVEKNNSQKVDAILSRNNFKCCKVHPEKGLSALHLACRGGYTGIVDKFLQQKGFTGINSQDSQGLTAIHYAAKNARYSILLKLLQCNPDLSCLDNDNRGALHHASHGGHINCVQLLINSAAPISDKDKNGQTPLAYAAEKGQASICRLLMENGCGVDELDHLNQSALMLASINRHACVCAYLVGKGAKVDLVDVKGHSALWYATWNMDKETSRVLGEAAHKTTSKFLETKIAPNNEYTEREIIEDDHYEDVSTGRTETRMPFASSPCILKDQSACILKDQSACNLFPMFQEDFKLPPISAKSSSLVHLHTTTPVFFERTTEVNKEVERNTLTSEKQKDFARKTCESVSDGKLHMASFRALLDDTFPKSSSFEEAKQKESMDKYATQSNNPLEPPKNGKKESSFPNVLPTELIYEGQITPSSSTSFSHQHNQETPSYPSLCSSKTAETLSGSHSGHLPHNSQPSFTNTFYSDNNLFPSSKYIQSYEMDSVNKSEKECSKDSSNSLNYGIIPLQYSLEEKDVNEEFETKTPKSENEKNYILIEKLDLLEKLKFAMENRDELEDEKKDLLKKLEIASVSQQWTLHELRSMKVVVDQMLVQTEKEDDGEEAFLLDQNMFVKDLKSVQARIDELLELHEEGFTEEDQGLMATEDTHYSSEHNEYLNKKIISLVKEKNLLAFKLKQILGENFEMNNNLKEVEVVIENAIDLKNENEKLIKDYEHFKKIKEEEFNEVDELVKLLKETLTENESLKLENEGLLEKVKETFFEEDVEEMRKENLKLMYEKVQLEEALKLKLKISDKNVQSSIKPANTKLSQTLQADLRSDEDALSKQNKLMPNTDENGEEKNEFNDAFKGNNEQVKLHLFRKEQDDDKELMDGIKKAMVEYEDLNKEIFNLKIKLKKRSLEVQKLNDKNHGMSLKLNDSFEDYKKALETVEKNNEGKLTKLRTENGELSNGVEQLKSNLEKKEFEYQILNSNFNLEKRQKHVLEELRDNVLDLAAKTCEEYGSPTNVSMNNTEIIENLKNSVEESLKLKKKNVNLKNQFQKSELKNEIEKSENKKLKPLNDNLQVEIASLKRTIREQSAYLAILSPRPGGSAYDETDSLFVEPKLHSEVRQPSQVTSTSKSSSVTDTSVESAQKTEIEKLKNELVILTSQIECLEQNEKQLLSRSRINIERKDDELKDLENEVSKLNKSFSEVDEVNSDMRKQLKEYETKLDIHNTLNNEWDNVMDMYYTMSGTDNEHTKEKKEVFASMRDWLHNQGEIIENKDKENEHLKQELELLKKEHVVLEINDKAILDQLKVNDVEHNFKLQEVQSKLYDEVNRVKELQKETITFDQKQDHLKNELNMVMEKLIIKNKEFAALEKESNIKLGELREENRSLIKVESEKNILIDQLGDLTSECGKMSHIIIEKNEEILILKDNVNAEMKKNKEIHEDLLSIENKMEEVEDENVKLKKILSSRNKEMVHEKCFNVESLEDLDEHQDEENFKCQYLREEIKVINEKSVEDTEIEKKKDDLENKISKLEADFQKIVQEKETYVEKIKKLEKFCNELKRKNDELNEINSSLHNSNNISTEKFNCNETPLKECEKKKKIKSMLSETAEATKQKLEKIEKNNHKLLLQKKQSDMMVEIEKLKSVSEPVSLQEFTNTSITSDLSISEQRFVPLSAMPNGPESNVDEGLVDHIAKKEINVIDDDLESFKPNFSKDDNSDTTQSKQISSYKPIESSRFLRNIYFIEQFLASSLCPLRIENRRTFLDIAGLQSCLRRKMYFENNSEQVKEVKNYLIDRPISSNNKHVLDYDDDAENNNSSNNTYVEEFLNALSNKCFASLSVSVGLEEKVDCFLKNILKDLTTEQLSVILKETLSDLVRRFTIHKNTLHHLRSLMQSVLDGQLDLRSVFDILQQPTNGLSDTSITLRSDYVFNTSHTYNNKNVQNSIRILKNSDTDVQPSTPDGTSLRKLKELQNQLKENERRYREVISSYRRHLLSAVQGDMDPSIRRALLNIVEPHADTSE